MSHESDAIQGTSPRAVAKALETWHQEQLCSVIRLMSGTFFFSIENRPKLMEV